MELIPQSRIDRNNNGVALALGGFCVIIISMAADASGPVKSCNCWSALYSPSYLVNAIGHVVSSLMIFYGGKKMDW